jgi:FkbM family methyltransferase
MNRRSFMVGAAGAVSARALVGASQAQPKPKAQPEAAWRIPPGAQLSFSQQGEDIVLFHLLKDGMKIDKPTYLDIGAADPIEANNTYLLHWNGGHGVLVEPNPMFQERLHMHRPFDTIVQAGIGVTAAAAADYYVFRGNPALNTFSRDDVEVRRKEAGHEVVEKVLQMPLITVNDLIARHLGSAPDLLSIDIEGWDLAILRSLDFQKYRPAVIIAESQPTGPIPRFLASKRYVLRGASMFNAIFADPKRYR